MSKCRKDKPPKDGKPFIAMCGCPWPTMMMYNAFDDDFVYVEIGAQELRESPNAPVKTDTWFENEHCKESEITHWMPMPSLPLSSKIKRNAEKLRARGEV